VRWVCLLGILSAEFIAISLRFDARTVRPDRALSGFIAQTGPISRLGIAIGLATLMIAGPRCLRLLRDESRKLKDPRWLVPAFGANLLAFLAFYGLSSITLEGGRVRHWDLALVLSWMLAGFATLLFWAMAIIPARLWHSIFRECGGNIAAGASAGMAAYLLGLLARDQWSLLSRGTFGLVAFLLSLVFSDTVCQPDSEIVGTSSFAVSIAPVCSGYEGMGMMAGLLGVSLWLFRRDFRFPRALALLPMGMFLMWLSNALRITTLVALGTWGYERFAIGGFHSLAGWLLFLLIGLALVVWARQSPFFSTVHPQARDSDLREVSRDGAYLVPAMAIIATAMITVSLAPGFDVYYPARVIAAGAALLVYRGAYTELRPCWSWQAVLNGCLVFALWMSLEPLSASASTGQPAPSSLSAMGPVWAAVWVFFRVFGSVVTVPLAEELAFRGYLTRRLISADFTTIPPGKMTWLSFIVSSVLFGALHGRWVAGTLAGMAYALAYRRRGELGDAVLAHGVTNALIAITVLATGQWSLWN
jgi:exosortase E/protease (VPEID-CTERM system)